MKKFFFIANNPKNLKYLNEKIFNKNDIIIVFNKSLFENHFSFKNAFKIFHFYRSKINIFQGIQNIKNCNCNKFFIGKSTFSENHLKQIKNYGNSKNCFDNYNDMLEKFEYNKLNKSPQAGSLVFEFLKLNNYFEKNTQIFLVGFTSIYKKTLWEGHSKELEDNYFKFQMEYYTNLKYENNHLT